MMENARGSGESSHFQHTRDGHAHKGTRPGILVFSRTMQLLHLNQRALELAGQSDKAATGPFHVVFSTPVIELRAEVRQTLDSQLAAGIREPFEVRKTVCNDGKQMLFRGFGLPDRNAGDRSRIIIIFEQVGLEQEDASGLADDQLSLVSLQEAVA